MPDLRLDAVTSAIANMQSAWSTIATDAKADATPRDVVDTLNAGTSTMSEHLSTVNSLLVNLPVKDIAIDLHTPSS